ncbi:hypothetical protein [Candidatus Coxiella mudrowiae]|uniref:hypothetical protein n=1 Tax=Candidatus Coxiella mudrowiae TaxID=2054173 RepID=UPI00352C5240
MRRAMQRRSKSRAKLIITYGEITLDPASHVVTFKGKEVMVSRRVWASPKIA